MTLGRCPPLVPPLFDIPSPPSVPSGFSGSGVAAAAAAAAAVATVNLVDQWIQTKRESSR